MGNDTHTQKSSPNPLPQIKTALVTMAVFRGAKPDGDQIASYAVRLVREISGDRTLEDVIAAIEKIADMERQEGEPTFPPVATIMAMVPVMAMARRNRRALEQDYKLVMWKCGVCGYECSGFLAVVSRGVRFCPSKWGPLLPLDTPRVNGKRPERIQLQNGQTCGAEMFIVVDERSAAQA
jgi:hypothetical protein